MKNIASNEYFILYFKNIGIEIEIAEISKCERFRIAEVKGKTIKIPLQLSPNMCELIVRNHLN